ncbi:hypothetical protein MPER_02332 [Moniliophthora perniciosa FA553]|nr:hypothetical protein MPER_02332 [Moniliophthora perniciosa FA553]
MPLKVLEARFPPPKCHPETRQEVQAEILEWIRGPRHERPICWLHGPAGAGKSAIAQTIAEVGESEGFLGASFFFSRNHGERSRADYLFPTIAYQLARKIPELNDAITQILQKNPGVLFSSVDIQFRELVVNSCRLATQLYGEEWMSRPKVIIADGLDECTGTSIQQRIISLIASVSEDNFPFWFLVFSRPEPQIREGFANGALWLRLKQLGLDDSWDTRRDIKRFLTSGPLMKS